MYPIYSFSWYLSLIVTLMMLERQLFRGIALYNVYGMRSAFFGCLFPPLLPFRIIWKNIINFVSTLKAYIQFFGIAPRKSKHSEFIKKIQIEDLKDKAIIKKENISTVISEFENKKTAEKVQEKKFDWDKTEHSFLEKDVLLSFRRNLGDILVMKGYMDANQIKKVLNIKNEEPLGAYLLKNNFISEEELMESLAAVKHVPYLTKEALGHYNFKKFASEFNKEFLYQNKVLPLLKTPKGFVFAYSDSSARNAQSVLGKELNKKLNTVITTNENILKGIDMIWEDSDVNSSKIDLDHMYCERLSDPEQMIIIKNYAAMMNKKEVEIIKKMGLDKQNKI